MRRLLVLLLACSCGGQVRQDGSKSPAVTAAQTCEDYADVVGKYAQRCGLSYTINKAAFEKNLPSGTCTTAQGIRDESALRGTCFSFWNQLSCAEINDPNPPIPDACKQQILF
jgi:hypothetical protein